MLLHDSFFYTIQRYVNETHNGSITIAHSALFHSTITLIISIFGACSNFLCLLYLYGIISQNRRQRPNINGIEPKPLAHILSDKKYKFLCILTINDFILCLSSVVSCLDQQYYFQALVARFRLCSFHILVWKFTLHFIPLLIIFILFRYHYILHRRFPSKIYATTTINQLLFTDLCILIPFVIALAWSVDGLWLWGEADIKNFLVTPEEQNEVRILTESGPIPIMNTTGQPSYVKLDQYYNNLDFIPEQQIICYLQTNNDIDFTTRLLSLIQADYLLLFTLHVIGLILEIILHIRLSCCLIAKKISRSFIREQQLSLYILYIFICLTLTSLPFYLYRSVEILFDLVGLPESIVFVNSRSFAQIILCGISFKPVFYLILFFPSKLLFQCKCYTTIELESINQLSNVVLLKRKRKQDTLEIISSRDRHISTMSGLHCKLQNDINSSSNLKISTDNSHSKMIKPDLNSFNDAYV